jgi:hypothetical protein
MTGDLPRCPEKTDFLKWSYLNINRIGLQRIKSKFIIGFAAILHESAG